MKVLRPLFLVFAAIPLALNAQVVVNKPVVLNGLTPADRQATGLALSSDPDRVMTSGVEQAGSYRVVLVSNNDGWVGSSSALSTAPIPGTHVLITAPETFPGLVRLNLNGYGPAWVMAHGDTLRGDDVEPGSMLSVVFDGTVFHVLNGRADVHRECPAGMVAISEQYCVEPNERPAADVYAAFVTCAIENKRVCSWSEFYVACTRRTELGLQNMLNDWEWTNNACNEDNSVRVVGASTCEAASTRLGTGPAANFRCCYSR
ncbi:MAG: hypothetical protein JNM62_03185 [Flavobacteriales bacterium]|nr:hypothetical protein [Flavobacteriales bacterium]